jgi:hypothetical protein
MNVRRVLLALLLILLGGGAAAAQGLLTFKSRKSNFTVRYPKSWQLLESSDAKQISTDTLDIINFPNSQRAEGVVLKPGGAEITASTAPPEVRTIESWIEKDTKFNSNVHVHEVEDAAQRSSVCTQLVEATSLFNVGPQRNLHVTSYYCSTERGLFAVDLKNWDGDPNQKQLQATALEVLKSLRWQ